MDHWDDDRKRQAVQREGARRQFTFFSRLIGRLGRKRVFGAPGIVTDDEPFVPNRGCHVLPRFSQPPPSCA
jgi:hypothetical protein